MIALVIKVILVSIVVSALSYAFRLTPRYPKRIYRILVQILNTGLLTLLLTYLFVNAIEPGWFVLGSLVFLTLIVSIITTNFIARNRGSNPATPEE